MQRLIEALDLAVRGRDTDEICAAVRDALSHAVTRGGLALPEPMLVPSAGSYARRLLHLDPQHRYSVIVMVWGRNQGTPIHDHAGLWCVECVFAGRIKITTYDLVAELGDGRTRFRREGELEAGTGAAGSLIPPFDYHVIENVEPRPAVTIHVYGGEMKGCHAFTHVAGDVWRREWKQLSLTP